MAGHEERGSAGPEAGAPPSTIIVGQGEVPPELLRDTGPSEPWAMPPGLRDPASSEGPPTLFSEESTEVNALAVGTQGGTIDLRPNVLRGKARLTNENPDILALLAADPWHSGGGSASAYSTSPWGYSANTYDLTHTSPTELTFEMLVEAAAGGEDGVLYNVSANRGWGYYFPNATGVRVKPRNLQPEPTEVELTSCVGVVQLEFGTDETCETKPDWASWIHVSGLNTYWSGDRLTGYVRGGTKSKTYVFYYVNTPVGWVRTWVPVEWSVGCDEIVRICKQLHVPETPPVGDITGPFEVIGEPLVYSRAVHVHGGPAGSSGSSYYTAPAGGSPVAPLSDPSRWWKLSNLRAGDYSLNAEGWLRSDRDFTRFGTPYSASWTPGGPVSVVADQVTPLTKVIDGETRYPFVMRPSYFYGAIRLADPYVPLHPGSTSTLQSLYFEADYDYNGDGIPNNPYLYQTRLHASSSAGGYSLTSFPGSFEPASGELASNYEQVLPHTYDLSYTWYQNWLQLRFWSEGESFYTTPDRYDADRFRNGWLYLSPHANRSALMNPEDRFRIDHEYCFNEVQLTYRTDFGRFINPQANVSGSFTGTNWQGRQVSYGISGTFYGDPYVSSENGAYASSTGLLSMTLPQGTYTLRPQAIMVSDAGGKNSASFTPIQLSLGCGQRLKIVPPLSVVMDPIDRCATGNAVPVTGVVKSSPAQVDHIWYRVNGGEAVTLCTDCGTDPSFSFTANLQSCENDVQVFAYSAGLSEPATGSQQVVWDDPADGPSCPGTYCISRPPVARCKSVTVPADAECTSGCGSVDDGSYDPDEGDTVTCVQTPDCPYALGSQKVTLTCTDSTGLSSSCQATVTVKDMVPPTLACPAEPPVLACQDGGAPASFTLTASDNCGSVTTSCTPAAGSTLPLGTTTTLCTASDAAGNRASCSFDVMVLDEDPPELSCPEPLTAECTGNGSATVTLPEVGATDVCSESSVSGPSGTSSFPVGTTPLTYTATDSAGNSSHCTFAVTVADTQPPAISCPAPVTAECTGDGGAEVVLGEATAMDVCTPTQVQGPTATRYPVGTTEVTYSATDGAGHTATCSSSVTVVDTQPPVVTVGEPVRLWAPNHAYHTVRLADCGLVVEDACGGTLADGQMQASLDCVSSDEPENGTGDGNTQADIVLVDATTVKLRAERRGGGDGRVYRLHFTVRDAAGNATPGVCTALVMHDQRGTLPVDSGEAYRVCRE